jgi:hypothetical protein
VHLVHPVALALGHASRQKRRARCHHVGDRLRQNDLPEIWIAPLTVREMREIVSYRDELSALRTSAKAQIL